MALIDLVKWDNPGNLINRNHPRHVFGAVRPALATGRALLLNTSIYVLAGGGSIAERSTCCAGK